MTIVQIAPQSNGAHANQTTINPLPTIPEGWAVVPEGMETPSTFPFVDIEVDGQVVTAMTPGVVPEPDPEPKQERGRDYAISQFAALDRVWENGRSGREN